MKVGDIVITAHGPAAIVEVDPNGSPDPRESHQNICLHFLRKCTSVPDQNNNRGWVLEDFQLANSDYGWWVYSAHYEMRPLKNPMLLREEERMKIMRWKFGEHWKDAFGLR